MRSGNCPKCGGSKIGHLANLLDARTSNPVEDHFKNREFRILTAVKEKTGFMASQTHAAVVEALVCTECGYFEEYVKNPGDLPWETLPLFSWFTP